MTKTYPIEVYFRFYNCEDSQIRLYHGGKVCEPTNYFYIHRQELALPNSMQFEMRGKHAKGWDTIVDKQGRIIQDRFIKIVKVTVNNLIPNQLFLRKWPSVASNDGRIYTNYIGHNGHIDLEFDGATPAQWLMRSQRYMDNEWHTTSA